MTSLSDQIKKFSQARLKRVETNVMTESGMQVVEKRTDAGIQTISRSLAPSGLGYVGDIKPDLQVGQVLPGLCVGSQDVAHSLDLLRTHGVTHILNLAYGVDNIYPDDFIYATVRMYDLPETHLKDYFEDCFKIIDTAQEVNGNCLVHCNAGVSRSASIVIAYLMVRSGFSFTDAFNKVKEARPAIRPNDGFLNQLKRLDRK